jgi:hypothetical protein
VLEGIIAIAAAYGLGALLGILILGRLFYPVVYWLAGAPFAVGDKVMILRGPRPRKVAEVYEVWHSRAQVRLRLSDEERDAVADVFSFYEVLRVKEPNPQGGANGRQPLSSDTSRMSAAAASGGSCSPLAVVSRTDNPPMKSCPYCGTNYGSNLDLCPIDKAPLVSVKQEPDRLPSGPRPGRAPALGPAGPWLIFSGLPIAVLAVLFVLTARGGNIRGVSEKALPWVLVFVPLAVIAGCRELYHHLHRRLVLPIGIVGWLIAASLLCWFFWFGPGALRL